MTIKEFEIQYALGSLSNDDLIELASCNKTDKKILAILSKDKNVKIRWNVANNYTTSKEVLFTLSKDESAWVRFYVGINPNSPLEALKVLSKDKNGGINHNARKQINIIKRSQRKQKIQRQTKVDNFIKGDL